MKNTHEIRTEVFKLIREQLSPLAKIYGPLTAGVFTSGGITGTFFLTELNQWLWLPERVPSGWLKAGDELLSDAQLAVTVDAYDVLHSLLGDARLTFDILLRHLPRMKSSPTFLTEVAFYLTNPGKRTGDIVVANHHS